MLMYTLNNVYTWNVVECVKKIGGAGIKKVDIKNIDNLGSTDIKRLKHKITRLEECPGHVLSPVN